jgi:hypothetical protein
VRRENARLEIVANRANNMAAFAMAGTEYATQLLVVADR